MNSDPNTQGILMRSNPSLSESAVIIEDSIRRRLLVVLVGRCIVRYEGRAKSILTLGERLLIIKEDGAVLLHRKNGYEPTNWQQASSSVIVRIEKSRMIIRSVRNRPKETLDIEFTEVKGLVTSELSDEGEFSIHMSEEEIREALLRIPALLEEGFKPLEREKNTQPGFVDVFGVDSQGRLVIVEIKRRYARKNAVLQLAHYVDSVRSRSNREVRGILASERVSKNVQHLLATLGLEFKTLDLDRCAQGMNRQNPSRIDQFIT